KTYSGNQIVDAQPGVSEVVLTITPNFAINGHLTIEGASHEKLASYRVSLNAMGRSGPSAAVGADGKFSLDVGPGDWELNLTPPIRNGYIKSARFGDQDVRFTRLHLDHHTDAALNIVLSMNTATAQGEIESGRAGVVLAPVGDLHGFARFYYGAA